MRDDVRKTIRIPKMFNEELTIIAKEKGITFNALIENILYCYINNISELNNSGQILKKMDSIQNDIDNLSRKNNWVSLMVKQMFLNSGFPRNRTVSEDKAFNDFVEQHYKKKYE